MSELKLIKCECGSWTDKVFRDFKYADPKRKETFTFCYFCADGSDCWPEESIPPSEVIKLSAQTCGSREEG